MSWTGVVKKSISIDFELDKLSSKCVLVLPSLESTFVYAGTSRTESFIYLTCQVQNDHDQNVSYADWELVSDIKEISNYFYPISFEKVNLQDPKLIMSDFSKTQDGVFTVKLSCKAVAPFTWIDSELSGRFDKNGFVGIPNHPITLRFKPWDSSENVDVAQFEKCLIVYSLYDSL